jgi:hypothetical protein
MTQAQYQWLKNNGYDPTVYDVDDQGNIFENAAQKPEVMSPLRAGLTSFAGSVLPSAAGLGGAKLGMIAGAPFGPIGVGLGAIGGGLGAGYLTGKGQEAVLENYAPEAIAEMQRAQTDQPVASYVGGFAPSALAFRPSLQGMSSLLRPTAGGAATMREALTRPEFLAPAMNVAANVAGSTAGQLVNMSEGGEFSGPRFAADVALGTLFNKPTRLGRAMGFQDTPENVRLPDPDLAEARARKQTIPTETAEVLSPESVGVGQQRRALNAPRFDESGRLLNQPFADVEIDLSPEGVGRQPGALERPFIEAESAQRQLPNEGRKQLGYDPEQREAFIADKADESLENAFKQLEGPVEDRPAASTLTEDAKAAQDLLNEAKQTGNQENIAAAQEIYDDISKRFSRAGEEASNSITQEDINRANEIANRRGLKIELERTFADDGQEVRGMFLVDKKTGDRVIRINPFMATADTAIHEIGHDVFRGVTSKGMRRSLMDTAIDSPAFKSELAARQDEVRAGRLTEQQARDIALEEGLIQAFGERLPNVSRGELRQWFAAFKANIKRITTGKMSPEDALAWMDYATTEAVPWKGVAVAKGGEERMQRREKPAELNALDAQLQQAQEAEKAYKQQNPYDREGIKVLEENSKKAMNAYFEKYTAWDEANPKYPGIENAPEFLPSEDKYYRSFQDPADDQTGLRHMAQGKIWPDAFVMEIESPRGVIDANNNALRGRFKPEQVTKIIHDVDSFEPYPHDYIAELQRKYPNAEIVDGVLNDREDGYRILGPAKSEPTDAAAIRYQRAQQETPEFKNWFGESKVVDADGKPLTVYHGTSKDVDFNSFKGNKNGIWFTPNPDIASNYAMQNDSMGYRRGTGYSMEPTNRASRVIPAYVSLKNPAVFEVWPDVIRYATNYKKALGDYFTQLKAQGHDGVIFGSGKDATYVAFNPEQVKSATGNKGTFDPSNPDIRYQRGPVGKAADAVKAGVDKTLGEIDQITRRGGIYETVGRAMNRAYNTADSMLGKARSLGTSISKLSYADASKLTSHLYNEYRNQQLITPAPEIAQAYKEWRTQAKPFWVNEANKAGHQIRSGKGLRDRMESEFWLPGQKESDEVRDILASKVGTPEYQKLKDDYLRDATDDYLSKGMLQNKAQEKALADFEERRALINRNFDPSAPATFAGARKPMGRPLPESWVEKDFRKVFENYNRRSAKDYAAQEHFEKSPEVMAALGSKKFFNDQDIPANVLQNTDVIAPDPSVQSVMREFSGTPAQIPGKTVRSFGSMASALALQTISRIGDVGGTVTKPLAYIGLGDYGAYMGGMAEKLSNWSKLQARSIESGLNNPNAHQNFRQVVGVGEDAGKYMQKVLDGLGFITGSSKLESIARTLAQAQGEMIVSINKRKALTGDKDAVRFLDTLNADWRTQSDMDLAAQFGRMMQGSYDMRQLPAWFLEGGAAPYLTWSKWSMGQMNNFRKFAVEPAMQGNLKPLIAQVLVGMAGGGAIEQIQEWLNNKESKAVNWSELQSWAEQNEGQIGTDGGELLLQKLMMMAQKTGTFGFAGDLAMMPINALVGDTQSAVGVFPAAELATDLAKNLAGAITAIDKGEDVGLVLKRFGKNVIVGKTQMLRVANNWVDEIANEGAENLRSADRRKMRLFEELSGTGRSNGMFPVSYENLAEQEFERGSVTEKTGEEAFELVSKAREEATSREDYASRIRKYKTSQNQIMPSLERQPQKAARYLSFVEGAEEGAGAETMRRYMTREYENKYRKSLIEGMSGLR